LINKALERAQQKVEARNFEIRKTLIKFDNVLNDQRHVIFSQRKNVIESKNIFEYSDDFLNEIIDDLMKLKDQNLSTGQNKEFSNKIKVILGKNFSEAELNNLLKLKNNKIKENIIYKFKEIREKRVNLIGEKQVNDLEKRIFLQSIDLNWKSHIQYLEQLRQVIGLRSYGQRDPLIEYKKEAFDLFENLLDKLKLDFITILFNLKIINEPVKRQEKSEDIVNNPKCLLISKKGQKISRNDRCEATGKKFKNCCGAI
jgi:preprotein translocase subunit SecA